MIQIIHNGKAIGHMTEANLRTFLILSLKSRIVSQTATTISLEG